ncbi:hypothetical protein GCM10027160_27790 [Streptomyces calidiresistens]
MPARLRLAEVVGAGRRGDAGRAGREPRRSGADRARRWGRERGLPSATPPRCGGPVIAPPDHHIVVSAFYPEEKLTCPQRSDKGASVFFQPEGKAWQ